MRRGTRHPAPSSQQKKADGIEQEADPEEFAGLLHEALEAPKKAERLPGLRQQSFSSFYRR
jgi:hypothetical protein